MLLGAADCANTGDRGVFFGAVPICRNDVPSASMATVAIAIDLCSLQLPVLSCESYLNLLLQLLYGFNTSQGLLDAQVT